MSETDDRRVEDALNRLYQSATATLVTPEIEVIVQRAQRQRTTNAIVMVAVMAAVVATIALAGTLRRDPGLPPADSSPTATEPLTDGRVDPATNILAGFLDSASLREGTDAAGERRSGAPCAGSPIDQLVMTRMAGEDGAQVQVSLAIYDSEDSARAAFAVAAADLPACVGLPGAALDPEPWSSRGDESAGVTFGMPADGAGELTDWPARVLTVRVGRAVETFFSMPYHSHSGVGTEAATMAVMEEVASASLPRLCLYAAPGCSPAPGLPVPLGPVTYEQDVFLLVLRVFATDDPTARPGTQLAAAASAGYHPGIVRQGCDVGADFADADSAETTRYLALYFPQFNDAEEALAELTGRDGALTPYLQVLPVRTRCLS